MAHDVFISYSSKDKPIADGICAHLEGAGIRCWIAPRDISPGEDWPTAIDRAISQSRVMVLVFSAHSNSSEDVSRELFLAANSKLVIIPFKIENIEPEPGKRYYLARTHWLDAINPPTQEQIRALVDCVKALIPVTAPIVEVQPATPPREEQSVRVSEPPKPKQIPKKKVAWVRFLWIPGTLMVFLCLAVLYVLTFVTHTIALPGARATAKQPTLSFLSQNQDTPSPAGTPTSSNNPSFYPYREDFNDPQFDGALPPNIRFLGDGCSNIKVVQEKGSLTFQAPANIKFSCNVSPNWNMKLSQIKAVEFAMSTSPENVGKPPSFAPMLTGSGGGQKGISLNCGLSSMPNGSGCVVRSDQQPDIYHTKTFIEKPGDSYTFRIEVLNPDKMTFRFFANGETIGEFTMPPADVPVYKDLNYFISVGLNSMENVTTKAGLYFIDYLAIEQR